MKRYRTTRWSIEIEEIEVLRETDNFVILPQEGRRKERREAKKSDYHLYHETWTIAHAYLLQRAEGRVDQGRNDLERRINDLRIIENMQVPKGGKE